MLRIRPVIITVALLAQGACGGLSPLGLSLCELRPDAPECLADADSDLPSDTDAQDDPPPLTFDTALGEPDDTEDPFDPVIAHWTFTTCPDGWDLNWPWECGEPTHGSGPLGATEGSNVLATRLAANYPSNMSWTSAYAASPPITVPSQGATLSFDAWWHFEGLFWGSYVDGWHVAVFPVGELGTVLQTSVPYDTDSLANLHAWSGDASASGWQPITADLSPWANQAIHIRFAMRSDGGIERAGAYVDNVRITAHAPPSR